ncbi:MAG: TlpA disulfide reductase family protein [Verrucomicrobiota bacterium]
MKRLSCLIALVSLLGLNPTLASPADALRVQKNYEAAMNRWSLDMNAATTAEERSKVWAARPDAMGPVREIWKNIAASLDQDWTLAPAAWFLRVAPSLTANDANGTPQPVFRDNCDTIRKAIEQHHLKSPKLTPLCAALAASPDPRSLALLEKIQESTPDPNIQGVAALGAAMQLKSLGDNPEIMTKRLTYLRKAIIQSADVQLDGVPVSSMAEDELYIIRFLTKGRVAPDLKGLDSAGRPLALSSWQGKVIVLVFWNSNVFDSQRVVDITTALAERYKDKPLQVVGVNNDTTAKLRTLQANGTVTWPNFSDPDNKLSREFRVGTWPLVYVLDAERKVQYAGAPGSFVEFTAEALLEAKKPAAAGKKN